MFKIFILRSLVKPFVIWRNPNIAATANKDDRWTPRQLYLDAKGERAQHKVLQMAVRELQWRRVSDIPEKGALDIAG
jgi:hypothetical protein